MSSFSWNLHFFKKDLAQKICKRCKLHGRDTKADNWCAYCAQTLCDEHLEYHLSLTSGRHPVYDVDEVIRNPDIGFAAKKCRFACVAHSMQLFGTEVAADVPVIVAK
jgi:hypothetical protein